MLGIIKTLGHHQFNFGRIFSTGAVIRTCSVKKVFSEISQNLNENTCEFCEISKNTIFYRTPLVAAFVSKIEQDWNLDQNLMMILLIKSVCPVPFCKVYKKPRGKRLFNFPLKIFNIRFEIFKMFKKSIKFTKAACWTNSKISKRDNNTTFMMFLCCHYCWLIMSQLLKVFDTAELQILKLLKVNSSDTACFSSGDLVFIDTCNMTVDSVENHCLSS